MTIELDHMSLSVADIERAKKFYAAALAPLRMSVLMEFPMDNGSKVMGLGADGKPFLWISGGGQATHTHIALRVESRAQVDAFHAAAIAAGGKDNGGPGVREMYHPHYYAAFVLDPEGHNLEAVVHTPPGAAKAARKPAKKASAKSARKPAKRAAAKPARNPVRKAAAKKPAKRNMAARRKTRK
jgi:catechol 2,3-dioxygenase-like lactoylglutathione lyase family enzyme